MEKALECHESWKDSNFKIKGVKWQMLKIRKNFFYYVTCYILINNLGNTEKYKEESKKIAQYFHCSEVANVNIRWTLVFAYVQVEGQISSFIEMRLYSTCWWKYLVFLEHNKETGKESLALGKYLVTICMISL